MKPIYLIKSLLYLLLGLYYNERDAIICFSFLAVVMLFFWLDLSIKDYIKDFKTK